MQLFNMILLLSEKCCDINLNNEIKFDINSIYQYPDFDNLIKLYPNDIDFIKQLSEIQSILKKIYETIDIIRNVNKKIQSNFNDIDCIIR
jgi:hypothetical protein